MRFMLYDLKRMFSGKALVIMLLISPLAVIMMFSVIFAPMLYTAKGLHFKLAICDEDGSAPVREFINQLVNSQALAELVAVYPVPTTDLGRQLVESNDVSILVHIPEGLFEDMRAGKPVEITIFSKSAHALEAELITMTLESSLYAVGKAQNLMESAKDFLVKKGIASEAAEEFLSEATKKAISEYMERREILGKSGTVSPMGEYMPVEYYLSAVFSLFAALAMLPVIHYTAADCSGAILRRGLVCGQGSLRFYIVRLVSGMLLVFLVQVMLFPSSLLLGAAGSLLGGSYSTRPAATIAVMLLSSLCFSSLAIVISTWIPAERPALWTGFFLVLFMAVAGGALIPAGALPLWAETIGKWLPLRISMRALSLSLFNYNRGLFMREALRLAAFCVVLLPAGFLGLHGRGRGA